MLMHEQSFLHDVATPGVVLTLLGLALVLGACVGVLVDRLRAAKRGERSLETRFQTMLEGAPAAFFGIDADGRVAYVEQTGAASFRLISKRAIGRRFDEGGIGCPDLRNLVRQALSGRRVEGLISCDGASAHVRCLPVHGADGRVDGAVCVGSDVSERLEMERSLRLARFTLEQAADAVLWVDADARILEANREAGRQFGCDPAALVGRTILDINPHATEATWRAHWEDLLKRGSARFETEHRGAEGRLFPVEVSANLIELEGVVLNIAFVRDISERAEQERALRESEQRLELALSGADLGLWDWDVSSGRVEVNDRWATMLGYAATHIPSSVEHWQSLVHPDDLPIAMTALRAHLAGETERYEAEVRMRTVNGGWRWILSRGQTVERDEEGRSARVAGTHLDITRLKEVEEALRHSQERYRSVVEDQTDLICRYRSDTTLTFVNQAYVRSLGLRAEEAVGTRFIDLIPEAERGKIMGHVRSLFRTLTPERPVGPPIEHQSVGSDGEPRWQQWVDRGLFDAEGRLIEVQSVGRDITDRIEVEQRLRLLNSELNHRVKNNLGVVAALAERTARECDSLEDFRGRFASRIGAMARVHELIARNEWRPAPLGELLGAALGDFLEGPSPSIHLSGPPVTLSAKQAVTLSLIVRELVTNAAKHGALTGEGGRIDLSWGVESEGGSDRLALRWREGSNAGCARVNGGRARGASREGDGLGLRLIESLARGDLRGEASHRIREGLMECVVRFPLESAESEEQGESVRNGEAWSGF